MYVCGLGDERALFLKKRENPPSAGSDSGLRPPQGQKSVLEPMGAFSIYVCGLGDVRALFLEVSV